MGQKNTVPRRINRVEGAAGQIIVSQGPGVLEAWGYPGGLSLVAALPTNLSWSGITTILTAGENLASGALMPGSGAV